MDRRGFGPGKAFDDYKGRLRRSGKPSSQDDAIGVIIRCVGVRHL